MENLPLAEKFKEDFVYLAAHELKTPATAIHGYLSFALDEKVAGELPEKAKEFLTKMQQANSRLINLLEDLLHLARSQAHGIETGRESIDVRESVSAVFDELAPLATEKSISLLYAPSQNLPQIFGNPRRLKAILANLIGNGIKYTLEGGAVTVFHEAQNDRIITHVQDTGVGIPKEVHCRMFEKFYRVKNSYTEKIPGTGLGLFIVKTMIETMNGDIWFESEEGKGSIFSFSLPVVSQ